MMLSAMTASTGAPGTRTNPSVAAASVRLCATVNAVIVPIKRREAAEFLARELLNRRESGRLLHRYGDSLTAFFLDLAGALREAACWKLAPGRYVETADLVQRLVDGEE